MTSLPISPANSYRLGALVGLGAACVLLFGIGALGVIGAGGRADLMYLGVLGIGVIGALVARLRAGGMAKTLAAMAAAQVLVAVIALAAGMQDSVEGASVGDILMLNAFFALLFGVSAVLFRRSSRSEGNARV